jgi:hypothetical protein
MENMNMSMKDECIAHAWQKYPCIARGKLRTNHGDGTVYDWGRPKERRQKREDGRAD